MNTHEQLLHAFYTAFANNDAKAMTACYHPEVTFQDPAFGQLQGQRAHKMWEMLLSRSKGNLKVEFGGVHAEGETGRAQWTAHYPYGPKQRPVTNHVQARFKFKGGKIIEHIDNFDLWKWSRQALGPVGYLLGWSSLLRAKVQAEANARLDAFIGKG